MKTISDHKHIAFEIKAVLDSQTTTYRDPKTNARDVFEDKLRQTLEDCPKNHKVV